jgi:hypothetical protein
MQHSILIKNPKVNEGDEYGSLTAAGPEFRLGIINGRNRQKHKTVCLWKCGCGRLFVAESYSVRSGNCTSCGCKRKATATANGHESRKHGGFGTKLYTVWVQMKYRCYNSSCKCFANYGGRGIDVCEKWRLSFSAFREWAVENGWQPNLQIDRRDNSQGYSPSNCRFVSLTENLRNRRITKLITAWGETKPLTAWIEDSRCKCSESGLRHRLFPQRTNNRKWSAEDAISTPPLNVRSHTRE